MDINKLLIRLNFIAIIFNAVFYIYLQFFFSYEVPHGFLLNFNIQDQKPYEGIWLASVAILSTGPFVINHFMIRFVQQAKNKMSYVSLFFLVLMVAIVLFCFYIMYNDQVSSSKGWGLILCFWIYLFAILPLWLGFLINLAIIKRLSNMPNQVRIEQKP